MASPEGAQKKTTSSLRAAARKSSLDTNSSPQPRRLGWTSPNGCGVRLAGMIEVTRSWARSRRQSSPPAWPDAPTMPTDTERDVDRGEKAGGDEAAAEESERV